MFKEEQVERFLVAFEKLSAGVESMANNYSKCFLKEDLTEVPNKEKSYDPEESFFPSLQKKTNKANEKDKFLGNTAPSDKEITKEIVRSELMKLLNLAGYKDGLEIGGKILKEIGCVSKVDDLKKEDYMKIFEACQEKIKELKTLKG